MEPSPKRLRVDGSSQYNPGLDLQYDRQQNDLRLKGIFEHIFQKYAKDFTEVGDEIDLETGEIVVNNGHLSRMRHEQDIVGEGDARHFVRAFADGLTHEHGFGDSEEEDELSSDGPVIEEGQESSEDIVMIEDSEDEEDGGSVQLSLDTLHVLPVNPAGIARDVTAMDSAGESQTDIDNGLENSEPRHDNDPTQADIWNDFPAIGDALALSELSGPSRQSFNAGDVQALGLTIANQISEFLARSQHRAQPLESAWRTPQPRSTDFRRSLTRQDNKSIALRSPSPLGQRSLWAADPQPVARIRKRRLHSSLSGASTPRQLQSNPILDRLNSTHEDSTTNGNVVAEAHGFDLAPGVSVHGSLSDDDTLHTGYSANTKRRISSPQRAGSRRAPRTTFSRQEDELIIRLREENELDWRSIAKFLPDKPPQSIPLHYCRMLKPVGGPNARSVFSKQEDALIIKSREEDELDWRSIAELLPDKTPQSLLLHYSRKLKHRQKWQIEKSPLHSHTETVDGQEMSLPSMDTSRAVTTALDEQRESTQLSRLGDPRGFLSAMPLLADHFSEEDLVEQVQSKHKVDTDLPLSTNFGFPRPPRRLRHSASSINLRPTLETTHSTSVLKGQAALDALFAADAFLNESRNDASEDTAKSSHVVERTLLQNTKHTAYAVPKATDSTIAHDVSSKIRGDPSIEGRRSVHNLEESCGFSEKTTSDRAEPMPSRMHTEEGEHRTRTKTNKRARGLLISPRDMLHRRGMAQSSPALHEILEQRTEQVQSQQSKPSEAKRISPRDHDDCLNSLTHANASTTGTTVLGLSKGSTLPRGTPLNDTIATMRSKGRPDLSETERIRYSPSPTASPSSTFTRYVEGSPRRDLVVERARVWCNRCHSYKDRQLFSREGQTMQLYKACKSCRVYKSRTERMRRKQHSLLRKEQKEQELAEYSRRSGSPQVLIDSLVRVKEEVSPRIVSNRVGTREHVPAEVAPWWNAPESDTIEKKGLGESLPRKKVARKSTTGNNILSGSTPGSIRKAQKTPIEEDLLEDELAL